MDINFLDNRLILTISSTLYNEAIIYKCFYWYSADYSVQITAEENIGFTVQLQPKTDIDSNSFEDLIEKIKRDLVDFKLRDIVSKETSTIRELIIAKAFAYADIEQNPETNVSDPVGFDPKLIS